MQLPRHHARRALAALALCLAAGISLTACGGSGGGDAPPRVTFSDQVAAGTVENYTNADWLFQNYLGEYGIPEPVKPAFMPAMKLLANGFMLQLKTGQDVRANIEQVHALFLQFVASGEAAKFFAQVHSEAVPEVSEPMAVDAAYLPETTVAEPVISDEDLLLINEAKQRDEQERQEILAIAGKYQLPYQLDEGPQQWFIYSPTMKGGGKGGGTSSPSPERHHVNLKSWGWRPGDLIWVNGTGSITGVPGHNAIAWGTKDAVRFADANTDVGVSVHEDVQRWADRYTELRALTPKLNWDLGEYNCYRMYGSAFGCRKDSYQRLSAWIYVSERSGFPYNWTFTNPRNQARFYCSSLVWNAYNQVGYNVIAPKVLSTYGIVYPSDIRDSAVLNTFKISRL